MSFITHSAETAEEREMRQAVGARQSAAPSTNERRAPKTVAGGGGGHLRAFIERIERLEEEKKAIADDIKEVYAEAKGNGYDAKIIRKIVALRKQDVNKRREEAELLDLYLAALGEE